VDLVKDFEREGAGKFVAGDLDAGEVRSDWRTRTWRKPSACSASSALLDLAEVSRG